MLLTPRELTHSIIDTVGLGFMLMFALESTVKMLAYTYKEIKAAYKSSREE